MVYTYNKLVRDKIVSNINSQDGKNATYRILNDEEYLCELNKKLIEESHEFIEENNIEELADIMEVLESIMELKNISWNEVRDIQNNKRIKRGGFKDKIYLETVEE